MNFIIHTSFFLKNTVSRKYILLMLLWNLVTGLTRSIPIYLFTKLVSSLRFSNLSEIMLEAVYWALAEVMSLVLIYYGEFFTTKWKVELTIEGKRQLFSYYGRHSKRGDEARLIEMSSDMDAGINTLVSVSERITRSVFIVIFVGFALAYIDITVCIIYLTGSIVAVIIGNFFGNKMRELGSDFRQSMHRLQHHMQDMYNGLLEMKIRGNNEHFKKNFSGINCETTGIGIKLLWVELTSNRIYQIFLVILMTYVLWIAGQKYRMSDITLEGIGAIVVYGKLLSGGVVGIIHSFLSYKKNYQSINKYKDICKLFSFHRLSGELRQQSIINHPVKLYVKDINVVRNQSRIIEHISIEVSKGELLVITGENGVGKSSILDYLYNNLSGEGQIRITDLNGVTYYYDDNTVLRQYIGGTTQNAFITSGTIRENILLDSTSNEYAEEILTDYKKLTGLDTRKPLSGLDKPISGGQEKLLIFCRSLLNRSDFICLDEPTVYLDESQRHYVLSQLNLLRREHGVIIATHDQRLVDMSDKILNIDKHAHTVIALSNPMEM